MFVSHGSNHNRGVLILFSPHLDFKRDAVVIDEEWRYILFEGKIIFDGKCVFLYKRQSTITS